MKNPFRALTANDVAEKQRVDAERFALEYEASAEEYFALARMYRERLQRLNNTATLPVLNNAKGLR